MRPRASLLRPSVATRQISTTVLRRSPSSQKRELELRQKTSPLFLRWLIIGAPDSRLRSCEPRVYRKRNNRSHRGFGHFREVLWQRSLQTANWLTPDKRASRELNDYQDSPLRWKLADLRYHAARYARIRAGSDGGDGCDSGCRLLLEAAPARIPSAWLDWARGA